MSGRILVKSDKILNNQTHGQIEDYDTMSQYFSVAGSAVYSKVYYGWYIVLSSKFAFCKH